jgi:peptidyl-prolyl cis-trans isomerase D
MLNVLRQKAGSWIVKVLMLLLVVSFAIWGIGDVFFGHTRNPTVATVGGSAIPASELADAFNRALNNLQRQVGTTIDRQQAIQFGLMQQALQGLIARRLVDLRAHDMGLTVADDTLRQLITDNPAFQSAGRFDRGRFEQLLQANGLTENGYLALLREEVVRSTLTGSLAGPVVVPSVLVDTLYRYRNEQRRGHYVAIRADSITDVPEPSTDDLTAFHDAHQKEFTAPEYRRLTFITLQPEDLLNEIEVPEDKIQAEYQNRIEQFRTPERRTVEQLLAPDQTTVEKAKEQLATGATFADVAKQLADQGVRSDSLDKVAKTDLPPEIGTAIFGMTEGQVGEPVQSGFGWHIFKVTGIEPEKVTPLAEVHDQLRRDLALGEARDRLPTLATQLDDELAAGSSLADAAHALGLEAKSLAAIDAHGNGPDGKRPEALPPWPKFLTLAFETSAGETTLLEETDAGAYFVLKVDEVTPPRVKPVEEVHDQLREQWRAEQQRKLARERADQLLTKLKDGVSLDEIVAAEKGLSVTPIEPVKRSEQGADQGINQAVVRALFATEPGHVAEKVVELSDGFAVVGTDEVIAADPAKDPDGVQRLRTELQANMRNDLVAQFETDLRRDYPVDIDGAAVNRLIGSDGAMPASGAPRPLPSDF